MSNTPLVKEIQLNLLIIMDEFDRICKKNKINYVLDGGSMLGAIRHNGFIPWDDDMDVVMLRKDYKKFIRACKKDLDTSTFTLETTKTSKYYSYNFGKLKLNNTVFEEKGSELVKEHKGLYIDIFPLDKTGKHICKLQFKMSYFWQAVRWKKIKREFNTNHPKLVSFFAKITPLKLVNINAEIWMRLLNFLPLKLVCKICHYGKGKKPHSIEYYKDTIEWDFEKRKYYVCKEYEKWLTLRYGDWKTLPPVEDRKPTHQIGNIALLDIKKE